MTPDQFQQFRARLAAGRQPIASSTDLRTGEQWAFPRGWNECLDFVERTIKEMETGEGN